MIKTNDSLQIIEKQILYNRMSKNADTKPDTKYFYIFNDLIGYVTQRKDWKINQINLQISADRDEIEIGE